MPTWQPHLPALALSDVESLVCLGQSFVQVLDRAKSRPWLAQAIARCRIRICVQAANVFAAEFLDSPSSRQPMPLTSFPAWLGHSIVKPMFVNNLHCDFPLMNLQPHKSALPIYPTVGMAANTLRHCFGQLAKVCTSCTFNTVTNHPHQKNPTPSLDRFEVPLHRICSSSHSMFLPTKPLALPTFNNKFSPLNLRQPVSKPSCDTFCFWLVSFPQMSNTSYSQAYFTKFRCHS